MTPAQRRTAVTHLTATYPVSIRRACELVHLARSRWYHQSTRPSDGALADALREKAAARPRWGYRRLHVLLARDGWQVNHKRVRRIYRGAGLQVKRRKRKQVALARVPRPVATQPNQVWAMDFISDQCATGRRFRVLSLIDTCTRECLALEVDTSLPASRVVRVLDDVTSLRGRPQAITVDNALPWKSRDERDKATAGARGYANVSLARGALRRVPARGTSTKHESPTHHSQHSVVAAPWRRAARAFRSSHSMGARWKVRALSTRSPARAAPRRPD